MSKRLDNLFTEILEMQRRYFYSINTMSTYQVGQNTEARLSVLKQLDKEICDEIENFYQMGQKNQRNIVRTHNSRIMLTESQEGLNAKLAKIMKENQSKKDTE